MSRPIALITNDDSIESPLLAPLVEAASEVCEVYVVAPATEQSWIGRAYSRHRSLQIEKSDAFAVPTWTIDGTPSDCVNIALHHLLPQKPDIVLSGINIGYNATATYIYSSGTVAGALEGSFHQIPAIAFSKALPEHAYTTATEERVLNEQAVIESVESDKAHIPRMIAGALSEGAELGRVWNINFPEASDENTQVAYTHPIRLPGFSFYKIGDDQKARFEFSTNGKLEIPENTDIAAIRNGNISVSILGFGKLSEWSGIYEDDPLRLKSS
ncbi:MAG: 5'/3'-nucleotidase SurE [Verrucomicrobiota bacterium]